MQLRVYLDQLVEDHHKEKASSDSQQRDDLFSAPLRANQADSGSTEHLNRDEPFGTFPCCEFLLEGHSMIPRPKGNIFIGFFASHETTSDALGFTFIQLARHPKEQERLYHDVASVLQGCPKPVCACLPLAALIYRILTKQTYSDSHRFVRTIT